MQDFIHSIQTWYDRYQITFTNELYDDLVREVDTILTIKSGKYRGKHKSWKNRYPHGRILQGWTRMIREAHRKWEEDRRDEEGGSSLLEASRLCREVRNEARAEYWQAFTTKIGNTNNLSEIWREVRKVQGKVTTPVAHSSP